MAWIHSNLAVIFRNSKYKNRSERLDLLRKLGVPFRVEYTPANTLVDYHRSHNGVNDYHLDISSTDESDVFVHTLPGGDTYRLNFDCSPSFEEFFEGIVQYEIDDVSSDNLPEPERIDFPDLGVTLIRRTFDIKNH